MNDRETDKSAEERIADALERQTRLMEDRNAILHDGIQTILYALYDVEGRQQPDSSVPKVYVEDGLTDLNYVSLHGGRSDGQPEEDDRP